MSTNVITIVAIVSIVLWIAVSGAYKIFKRKERKKNNNFNVCRFLIDTNTNHLTFSKYLILEFRINEKCRQA